VKRGSRWAVVFNVALVPRVAVVLVEPPGVRVVAMQYQEIITIDSDMRGGKPGIRGMRITVYDVFSYLAAGMTEKEILDDFPCLTPEDILACYAFAAAGNVEAHL